MCVRISGSRIPLGHRAQRYRQLQPDKSGTYSSGNPSSSLRLAPVIGEPLALLLLVFAI
jgi:hypothetical protein